MSDITIKDVAKAAGVSVATVSRVLNGTSQVSEEKAELVKKKIEELNYHPNFIGRTLRRNQTKMILVTTTSASHYMQMPLMEEMRRQANALGYDIVVSILPNSSDSSNYRSLNLLYNHTVDGAIILGTRFPVEEIKKLNEKYHIALCCESIPDSGVLTVTTDDEKGGYDATMALLKKGHRKIALIDAGTNVCSSRKRREGYVRALLEYNIAPKDEYIYSGNFDYEQGALAMEKFMSLEDPPTAIFAVSDILATAVVKEATKRGLKIGKEFSVIGFDSIALSDFFVPSLSTVSQSIEDLAKISIEKLIKNMTEGANDKGHYFSPHKVVLRQTTGD